MHLPDPDIRVDWFRLLVDLQAEGYSLYGLAHFTKISKSSLLAYKQGAQPTYNTGSLLVKFWSEATGKPADAVPMVSRYSYMA